MADDGLDTIRTHSAEERRRKTALNAIAEAFATEECIVDVELAETQGAISVAREQFDCSISTERQQEPHGDSLIGNLWQEDAEV